MPTGNETVTERDMALYVAAIGGKYLPLVGGTMSGNIAMGTNKLTGLAAGVSSGDSVRFEQLTNAQAIARGWADIDGTGTPTADNSFNVDSITDHGTGNWSAVWTTDFANANYVAVATAQYAAVTPFAAINSRVVGSCQVIVVKSTDQAGVDVTYIGMVAFGDQ